MGILVCFVPWNMCLIELGLSWLGVTLSECYWMETGDTHCLSFDCGAESFLAVKRRLGFEIGRTV